MASSSAGLPPDCPSALKTTNILYFFNIISVVLMFVAFLIGYPLVVTWIETGLVPRIPTAIIVMGLIVLSFICVTCGLVLDCVARGRKEAKRLSYLTFPIFPK